MRPSPLLCALLVTLAAFTLTTEGTFAAINYNASKSNTGNLALHPKHPNSATACTDLGGNKACKRKLPGRMKSGTLKQVK